MIYEPKTKTYFVVVKPNPAHKGEYLPDKFEDDQFIRKVNHGMAIVQERNIDRVHDLLSPGYGLMIKYLTSTEFPSGENVYLYPNKG